MIQRRVFISATANKTLDERRRSLKSAILQKLTSANLQPQEFFELGLAQNLAWSFDNVDRVMRKCIGAIVIGFPRWTTSGSMELVGEYNHYEGAVAITHNLPVLLLAERGVENRGVVWTGAGRPICFMPDDADATWAESQEFRKSFDAWSRDLNSRKDVFLGYCSQNAGTAALIENRLMREGATVLNYNMDFRAGVSILSEISEACRRCSAGIFLFGENDPLEGTEGNAAPRDNVVFEAGFFMNAKGPDRCLIVRQGRAKMPADLGGAIYLSLNNANDLSSIERRLATFLEDNV